MNSLIDESITNESFLLAYGVKNLLKSLMKNYEQLKPDILASYVEVCLEKLAGRLGKAAGEGEFNRACLLLVNLCGELPLLDLPNVDTNYDLILQTALSEKNSRRKLGYLAVLGSIWDSAVGIDKLTP